MEASSPGPWIRRWGADDWSWNFSAEDDEDESESDGSGYPGRGIMGSALSFWLMQFPSGSAETASLLFNLPLSLAQDAFAPDLFAPCDLAQAIQTWSLSLSHGENPSVIAASCIFATDPGSIVEAIRSHPWMYTEIRDGLLCIGHEGE